MLKDTTLICSPQDSLFSGLHIDLAKASDASLSSVSGRSFCRSGRCSDRVSVPAALAALTTGRPSAASSISSATSINGHDGHAMSHDMSQQSNACHKSMQILETSGTPGCQKVSVKTPRQSNIPQNTQKLKCFFQLSSSIYLQEGAKSLVVRYSLLVSHPFQSGSIISNIHQYPTNVSDLDTPATVKEVELWSQH